MSPSVQNISIPMFNKPDYKKTYFEKILNRKPQTSSINGLVKIMRSFGYHFEEENGRYYVYSNYEWGIKKKFDQTIAPLLKDLE